MRDTVENFIASILLSLRQPFRPNDLVDIEGHQGRVIRLTGRATTLLSNDGNHIRIPNSTVFKAMITNYTRHPERRFSFDLGVDASADLAALRDLAMQTLSGLDFVLPSPAPAVWVEQVGDSNVVMRFTGWVKQNGVDFNLARGEAIRIIKDVLEKAGFGLPEPIYRLRIDGPDTGTPAPRLRPSRIPRRLPISVRTTPLTNWCKRVNMTAAPICCRPMHPRNKARPDYGAARIARAAAWADAQAH